MKLDRNINPDGRGKYAIIKRRNLSPGVNNWIQESAGKDGLAITIRAKEIETGGFFVMKYGDKFSAAGISAYALEVEKEAIKLEQAGDAGSQELFQYSAEVYAESMKAEAGDKIPL